MTQHTAYFPRSSFVPQVVKSQEYEGVHCDAQGDGHVPVENVVGVELQTCRGEKLLQ